MWHADEGMLHAYLDGELSAMETARLEGHLGQCEACQARLAEERALIERAQALLARAAPPDDVVRPWTPPAPAPGPRFHRWVPVAWAASVMLALGVGWWVRGGPEGAPFAEADQIAARSVATEGPTATPVPPAVERSRTEAAQPAAGAASRSDTAPRAPLGVEEERRGEVAANRAARDAGEQAGRVAPAEPTPVAQAPSAAAPAAPAAEVRRQEVQDTAPFVARGVVAGGVAPAWPSVSLDSARALLGGELAAIADLPIRTVRVSVPPDGVVMVVQELPTGGTVTLFERRGVARLVSEDAAPAARERAAAAAPAELQARYVGALRVEITGALSADSLSRLLERVRVMP